MAAWRNVTSASIIQFHEAFTTKAFGDDSIVFVYDYHPQSRTLYSKHFGSENSHRTRTQIYQGPISEDILWNYLTQLVSAVFATHSAHLSLRTIQLSKILVDNGNRIRLSGTGVLDVISPIDKQSVTVSQMEDFQLITMVIITLAASAASETTYHKSMLLTQLDVDLSKNAMNLDGLRELLSSTLPRYYSQKLLHCLERLLTAGEGLQSELPSLMLEQTMKLMDASLRDHDVLEKHLAGEVENGRLVRLLCKMGFINERPEFDHDERWSDTGERYAIKLFRDFVFHQVDEHGKPYVDLAHVLTYLNKVHGWFSSTLC